MTKRKKNEKVLTDEMKDYLQLQFKICQFLGERDQLFAEGLKTTKSSILIYWSEMRAAVDLRKKTKWTPDQLAILIDEFEKNPKFQPSQVAHKLGLDKKNKQDMRRIYTWKTDWKNKHL